MVGDRNLLLRAARTQRCAREGELLLGLTEHEGMLLKRRLGRQRPGFGGFEQASSKSA